MRKEFISGGRPQVIVDDDYGSLPQVNITVRNLSSGPAKEISFEFSAPVESSDGFVISELPYFRDGLDFIAPGGRISCHWDHLDNLLPLLDSKGLREGIKVITHYKDLGGTSYSTEWNLNPFIYKDRRYVHHRSMDDVVRNLEGLTGAVKKLSEDADRSRTP